jgi:hypothetical protein
VWKGTVFLKEKKSLVEGVPSVGCPEKLHEQSQLGQRLLKACLSPSHAGRYLPLETVPAVA